MSAPRVFADRFLADEAGCALDLATGDRALVRVERRPEPLAPWADRCSLLASLAHPWMAECLDFGAAGLAHTFEAYRLAVPNAGRRVSPARMAAVVAGFLRACGLDAGVTCQRAGPGYIVVPTPGTSGPSRAPVQGYRGPRGVRLRPRPALAAIVDRLRDEPRPGTAWCDVRARRGDGGRTLLRAIAREGRVLGWVPVSPSALECSPAIAAVVEEFLAGRHVLVLHDARGERAPEREATCAAVARLTSNTERPCLVVRIVDGRWAAAIELD